MGGRVNGGKLSFQVKFSLFISLQKASVFGKLVFSQPGDRRPSKVSCHRRSNTAGVIHPAVVGYPESLGCKSFSRHKAV